VLEVRVLGPIEVRGEGPPVPLGGARQRAVLGLLVLAAPTPVPTGVLVDRLWAGEPPATAVVTLQGYLSRLRKALAGLPLAIETRSPGYALVLDPDVIDARRFERLLGEGRAALQEGRPGPAASLLRQALELWRGPALADLADESFAVAEATRLEELRLAALEGRFEAELALGRYGDVVAELESLVAAHPLREGLRAQLMRALHGSGRTAEALRVYSAGRELLAEELGIEPGSALQRLENAILVQDPSVEPEPPPPPPEVAALPPLPVPLTTFVGREQEVRDVDAALERSRLVTLVGPGGTGKTRLAVQVATERSEAARDSGVVVVELAALVDPDLLPSAVADVVGVHDTPGCPLTAALVGVLCTRPLLLVLDNCEHLIDASADLARSLLVGCPEVRILATSREPLGLPGEVAWPVPALPLPSAGDRAIGLDEALRSDAVRLFVERAREAAPNLRLTDADAPTLVSVCRRLDGMPLALELAAARLRVLSLDQVATRLRDRFRLLTGGSKAVLPRQRTLRAAVEWSYDLLEPSERLLFERLSVFAGSFGLELAEAVCADDELNADEVLDLLGGLVAKSLVARVPDQEGTARYRLLETLRDYAADRLAARGDDLALRRRHAVAITAMAEEAGAAVEGPGRRAALEHLAGAADDARLALEFALDFEEADLALRLTAALWPFWDHRYDVTEGRSWLDRALDLPGGPPAARLRAMVGAAKLAMVDDDYDVAAGTCREGLALAAGLGVESERARLLAVLAEVHRYRDEDPGVAEVCAEEALALAERTGDEWWQADASRVRALLAWDRGDATTAASFAERCLRLSSGVGDLEGSAGARSLLGTLARERGDLAGATELYEGALTDFRQAREPWGTAQAVRNLGSLAVLRGDADLGWRLAEESLRLHDELGNQRGVAMSYVLMGEAALVAGELDRAAVLFGEALDRLGTRAFALERAEASARAGEVALRRGDPVRALELVEEGLAPYRTSGQRRGASRALWLLARVRTARGDTAAAVEVAEEAAELARSLGDDGGAARALDASAEALLAGGDVERAARALAAAAMTRRVAGVAPLGPEAEDHAAVLEGLRTRLGDPAFGREWAAEWPEVIDLREPATDLTPETDPFRLG
jgi:predicted ATPase/DNA-binding SARP family transcriptional activator